MTNALTYGAGPNDIIKLVQGSNPATPVGGQAPNPIQVQVLTADGTTPVSGASVFFTSSPAVSYSACAGAASCTLLTDESGEASTRVTPLQAAVINLSVLLAPASYHAPKSVQATLLGISAATSVSLLSPFAWIAQGATVDVALAARILNNGMAANGAMVNFQVVKGAGTLSAASVASDVNGLAGSTLHLAALAGDVQVSACIAPANMPCQIFAVTAVPVSAQLLQPVAGTTQILPAGQNFQPLTVRVTDSAIPAHPVLGANVIFQLVVSRPVPAPTPISIGGIVVTRNPAPIIVSSSQTSILSDAAGLATVQPPGGTIQGAVVVQGSASAGSSILPFRLQTLSPVVQTSTGASSSNRGDSTKSPGRIRPRPQTPLLRQ